MKSNLEDNLEHLLFYVNLTFLHGKSVCHSQVGVSKNRCSQSFDHFGLGEGNLIFSCMGSQ